MCPNAPSMVQLGVFLFLHPKKRFKMHLNTCISRVFLPNFRLYRPHNPEVAGSSPASATKKKDICFQQMSFFCVQTPGAGRAALLNRPAGIARFQRVFRFSSPFRGGRPLPQPGSSPSRKPISSRRRAMNRPSISDSVSPARRITPISMVKLGMGTEWIPIWSFRSGGRATPTL